MDMRPAPSRRKSSNLLASLARQNTLSEREKEMHRQSQLPTQFDDQDHHPAAASARMIPSSSSGSTATVTNGVNIPSNALNGNSSAQPPSAPTAHNTPSSQSSFGVALENLRYLLQKRVSTFTYLKRAHEGKVHWFDTILLQKEELETVFDSVRMAKRYSHSPCLKFDAVPKPVCIRYRTVRFAVLGMSLSVLLEVKAAHDFLRGLLSLLQEFDSVTDENFKAKTVCSFIFYLHLSVLCLAMVTRYDRKIFSKQARQSDLPGPMTIH